MSNVVDCSFVNGEAKWKKNVSIKAIPSAIQRHLQAAINLRNAIHIQIIKMNNNKKINGTVCNSECKQNGNENKKENYFNEEC